MDYKNRNGNIQNFHRIIIVSYNSIALFAIQNSFRNEIVILAFIYRIIFLAHLDFNKQKNKKNTK